MDVLMIYPETKEQLTAYQSLAKAFQNRVIKKKEKEVESPYDPAFVAKILEGREDFKNGRGTTIKIEDLWK